MTLAEEAKQLRTEVGKLRPDKRRRYSADLRRRLLDWVARAEVSGMPIYECSRMLGIKTWRFQMWRESDRRAAEREKVLALVPVEMPLVPSSSVVLMTPSGYRVEGLTVEQVVALLRELV
jgi:hypothetical protein